MATPIDRRTIIVAALCGAGALPTFGLKTVRAQTPRRIAFLGSGAAQSSGVFVTAIKQGLHDHGLNEGHDYILDARWAEGNYSRFPSLARELVDKQPAAILVTTIAAVRAAQAATTTIPIVMTAINDPVGAGLIASLSRPGANTTGVANLSEDVTPKVLDVLHAVLPQATAIAALLNPGNPSNQAMLDKIVAFSRSFGATIHAAELTSPTDLDAVFDRFAEHRADALVVINDATILDLRERILALALRNRIPAFSSYPEFTDAGALVGYGPSRLELYRRSAYYLKRIFDGARPADLPVEQPTRIELSINLKTAKSLGITIPDLFLARADRVIE
jgi:putative tryptophan/tyrosine transport system substrate-binding protein